MPRAIVDTGVWIALCDKRDTTISSQQLAILSEMVDGCDIVQPWPLCYEVLRTRMARNERALAILAARLREKNVTKVDDRDYVEQVFASASVWSLRHLSMADTLIRAMLADRRARIDFLFTFNRRDFDDIATSRGIEIVDQTALGG
jgi:predicted nucleic acid-binding protein